MNENYLNRLERVRTHKHGQDPTIDLVNDQLRLTVKPAKLWHYFLWLLLMICIPGFLIYDSNIILILVSAVWFIYMMWLFYSTAITENNILINLTEETFSVTPKDRLLIWLKLVRPNTFNFNSIRDFQLEYKSFGRYRQLGRRISVTLLDNKSLPLIDFAERYNGEVFIHLLGDLTNKKVIQK